MLSITYPSSQEKLAALVPGARHVTDTHSGHNMMIDQPELVIDAIRDVVDVVRDGRSAIIGLPTP
jgi:pimeloyl-ACP methyl ester carboxylesterase